ncbi:hypothetical protein [Ferrovum sp.]|uniref:hypothetical protein n=1 Tax=Ferrovum sp. TaxID=2609467 RepID=UPI00261D6F61|nr:hypothetical protein [Ferrovum sp.]
MNIKSFENWFEDQVSNGLVDIKFAVTPGKGVTSEAIKNELLASEAMINSGYVMELPPCATSVIPELVMEVIRAARV